MNKEQFQELQKQSISILRAQYDGKKCMWKIVKMSWGECSHGWKRFGAAWHYTQQDAEASIERIVNLESNKCVTEVMAEAHFNSITQKPK